MSVADFAEAKTARSSVAEADLAATMARIGRDAREAARILAVAPTEAKNDALVATAYTLRDRTEAILAANRQDLAAADGRGITGAFRDRLVLNASRIEAMARGIEEVAGIADPVGVVLADWTRPNGLRIERVRTPLGVIGVIYESRPNVTADAGALTLKAGNAVILRGGSESAHSSAAIHECMVIGLVAAGLPEAAIQIVPTTDRAAVGMMLTGLSGAIDVIVPRGGRGLVERVQAEARVPVFAHLEGINHVYIDRAADLAMATQITVNAKMRRTGVCGAAETLLIDREVAGTHLVPIVQALQAAGCVIRGDAETRDHMGEGIEPATEADWSTEYLDAIMAVKVVDGIDEAVNHIERYGSRHTDSIVTSDVAAAAFFLDRVDSAIVLHNASTQFADGAEFGMGAEIGIATGKLHARGPIGVEQLTTFKYRVHGTGQTRP